MLLVGWAIHLDRRLRNVEQNVSAILRHFKIEPTLVPPPSDEVIRLASDPSRRIYAMRLYRKESGADVRVAIQEIDALTKS